MENIGDVSYKEPTFTFEECRSILCKDGESYTDEEIEGIRQLILKLVRIEYMNYARGKLANSSKVVALHQDYKQAS